MARRTPEETFAPRPRKSASCGARPPGTSGSSPGGADGPGDRRPVLALARAPGRGRLQLL